MGRGKDSPRLDMEAFMPARREPEVESRRQTDAQMQAIFDAKTAHLRKGGT